MIRAAAAAASRACSLKFSVSTPIDFTWDTTLNGGAGAWPTTPTSDTRYVYDGWNVILELDALNSNAVQRKFTWGLDLSGTRQGAGGIGGLLAVEDASGTPTNPADDLKYLYFHDANGNVGQLIDWRPIADWQSLGLSSANDWHASRLVARYEYDAYGNSLLDSANAGVSGPYAAANLFRFSTKYCEGDLDASATSDDLYYYGYRYYRPDIGRWVNRDPEEEEDGANLMAFCGNDSINYRDALGLFRTNCTPWKAIKATEYGDREEGYAREVDITIPDTTPVFDIVLEIVGPSAVIYRPMYELTCAQANIGYSCRAICEYKTKCKRSCQRISLFAFLDPLSPSNSCWKDEEDTRRCYSRAMGRTYCSYTGRPRCDAKCPQSSAANCCDVANK